MKHLITLAVTGLSAASLWLPGNSAAQTVENEAAASTATAPETVPAPAPDFEPGRRGRVDVGMGYSTLTGGNSNWNDQFVRGHIGLKPGTTLNWDLASQRHFDERGTVGALSLTHTLSP